MLVKGKQFTNNGIEESNIGKQKIIYKYWFRAMQCW